MTSGSPYATILYTAQPALWVRLVLIAVGVNLALLIGTSIGTSALSLLLADGGTSPLGWAALALALPCLFVVLALVLIGQRPRFTVSTTGIVIRTPLRTRRLPWRTSR